MNLADETDLQIHAEFRLKRSHITPVERHVRHIIDPFDIFT